MHNTCQPLDVTEIGAIVQPHPATVVRRLRYSCMLFSVVFVDDDIGLTFVLCTGV